MVHYRLISKFCEMLPLICAYSLPSYCRNTFGDLRTAYSNEQVKHATTIAILPTRLHVTVPSFNHALKQPT